MSETKPVNISFKWDKDTVLDSFDAIYNDEYKNSPRRLIGWLFLALSQFGVVAALKQNSFGLLIFSTIVLVYWFYFKKIIAKKRALKLFEKDPLKDKTIVLTADKEGFKIDNQFFKWEDIVTVEELEKGFLIITPTKHYFIPMTGFKSYEDKSRFKSFYKN